MVLAALLATLIAVGAAAEPADSTGVFGAPDSLFSKFEVYVGAASGTAFEDYLGASEGGELAVSGSVLYRSLSRPLYVEYKRTFVGDEDVTSGSSYNVGYRLASVSGVEFVGAAALAQELKEDDDARSYGLGAWLLYPFGDGKLVRAVAEYDGGGGGGVATSIGFYVKQFDR